MRSLIKIVAVALASFCLLILSARTASAQVIGACYGTMNVCVGNTFQYEYDGPSTKFTWRINGGYISTGNPRSRIIHITWTDVGEFSIGINDLSGLDPDGCSMPISVKNVKGGTLSPSNPTVCPGGHATLTLSGRSGDIQRWETSTDGANWESIPYSGVTYTTPSLNAPTQYRAVISDCSSLAYSAVAQVNINSYRPAELSLVSGGKNSFCAGESASGTLVLSAEEPGVSITYWEISESQGKDNLGNEIWGSWQRTGGHYMQEHEFSTNKTARFRVFLRDAACWSETQPYSIMETTPTTAGHVEIINGVTPICPGTAVSLRVVGNVGDVEQWHISDVVHSWNQPGAPSGMIIERPTSFAATVRNGGCASKGTGALSVTFKPAPTIGTLSSSSSEICENQTFGLEVTSFSGVNLEWQIQEQGTTAWTTVLDNNTSRTFSYNQQIKTSYWMAATKNSCGNRVTSNPVLVTVNPTPILPVTSTITICPGKSAKLSVNNPLAPPVNYNWYKSTSGSPQLIATTSTNEYVTPVLNNTTYHVAFERKGCKGPLRPIQVNLFNTVPAPAHPYAEVVSNPTYTVKTRHDNVSNSSVTYYWQTSPEGMEENKPGNVLENPASGYYYVRAKSSNNCWGAWSNAVEIMNISTQTYGYDVSKVNYVRSYSFLNASTQVPYSTTLITENDPEKLQTVTQYIDGLGRPLQQVAKRGSPAKQDVINPAEYDAIGRKLKEHLPYVSTAQDGSLQVNPFMDQLNFYQTAPQSDHSSFAFSYNHVERSPLDRPLAIHAPGEAWVGQAGSDTEHSVKKQYTANLENEVLYFTYNAQTGLITTGNDGGSKYYLPRQLYANVTIDEHNNEIIEYTNKQGQVIAKKVQYALVSNIKKYACTYYIYDDFGHLACVIQPEGTKNISEYLSADNNGKEAFLKKWAFRYKYDERRRMIMEQVPGAEPVYMVYDRRDRLVMTQDGEQRKSNKWSFTKYDDLNRPIITGIYTHNVYVDHSGMNARISTTNFSETYTNLLADAETHGYSNVVFPKYNDAAYPNTQLEILTVTYYDNYKFLNNGVSHNYLMNELGNQYDYDGTGKSFPRVTGQITGTKVKMMDFSPVWLLSVNHYDDHYRLIQVVADDHKNGLQRTTNTYDFAGKVLQTRTNYVNQRVTWRDLVNVAVADNQTIKKNAGASDWIAGAVSAQILPPGQDGYVEFTYNGGTNYRAIGLSDQNTNVHYNTIDYSFFAGALSASYSQTLSVYENGSCRYGYPYKLQVGDKLRVERIGTTIYYKVNGITIYTSTVPSTTQLMADFSLNYTNSTIYDTRISFGNVSQPVTRKFDYDHAGRLLKTWHSINESTPVLLAKNEYNELGQLVTKKLHSTNNGSTFKQHEDFRYNIRGWLERINNSDLTPDTGSEPRDLFGMNLSYNDVVPGISNTPQYNGNISAIKWSNSLGLSDVKENAYKFGYDPMNRLLSANHHEKTLGWNASTSFHENNLKYDLNGNILHLARRGAQGIVMDELAYHYNGNQLLKVDDTGNKTKGFKDGANIDNDYTYDAVGNMTLDKNKDITSVTYNHLNLPARVNKSNGEYIKYSYDAGGRKLNQSVYNASNILKKKTDYVGEYFYENDTLKFINHEEGRIILPDTHDFYSASGLLADYAFTGNASNGVSANGMSGSVNGAILSSDNLGNGNNAYSFDGNDFIELPGSGQNFAFVQNSGVFTVSLYLKLNSLTGLHYFMGNMESSVQKGFFLLYGSGTYLDTKQLAISITRGTGGQYILAKSANNSITDTNWHHISVVGNGSTITWFVDGVQSGSPTPVSQLSTGNGTFDFYLGGIRNQATGALTAGFSGSLDEIKIFNKALSPDLISKLSQRIPLEEPGAEEKLPEYQYHLKDHLGNVRLTFTTKEDIESPTATMETANVASEQSKFLYYEEAVKVNTTLFDHTNAGGTFYSTRLNGSANERTGLARSISVMPGDTVKTEVYAKYLDTNSSNWTTALNNFITSIANATAPPGTVIDGGAAGSTGGATAPFGGLLNKSSETGTAPKAYLNYIIFDRDYNYVNGGFVRMTTAAREYGQDGGHEKLAAEFVITQPGYVYIYLSNDNAALGGPQVEVYFDDLNVEHVKSPIISMQDYYPFGLEFNSYTKENSVENKYTYNGKEKQDELGLGWLDFGRRMYQPDIGRFMVHDRFTEKFFALSSYQFAANNPLSFIDINGDSIISVTRSGQNINIVNSPAEEGGENFTNSITLESDVAMDDVSDYSAGIVNDAMVAVRDNSVTVTSGTRTPEEQASAMYNNLESGTVAGEKKTYGPGGDKVIDTYSQAKAETREVTNACGETSCVPQYTPGQIKQKMVDKINSVGPGNVSNHTVGDRSKMNVFDIKPGSVSDPTKFHNSLSGDTRIKQVLSKVNKPAEKAIHVEILQNKK